MSYLEQLATQLPTEVRKTDVQINDELTLYVSTIKFNDRRRHYETEVFSGGEVLKEITETVWSFTLLEAIAAHNRVVELCKSFKL